jgi:hypothetical protein
MTTSVYVRKAYDLEFCTQKEKTIKTMKGLAVPNNQRRKARKWRITLIQLHTTKLGIVVFFLGLIANTPEKPPADTMLSGKIMASPDKVSQYFISTS